MNTPDLRITLVQTDPVWHDPSANRATLDEILAPLAGRTDLVILPEMFTTGFSNATEELAEPPGGPTEQWLQGWAIKLDAAVTGSIIVKEGGRFYNRLLWVRPGAVVEHYDKHHLFTLAGEHEHFQRGYDLRSFYWRGWNICPQVCYDLRFPEWARNALAPDGQPIYDLLLYVASWPAPRARDWRILLEARAIENQCYVAAVNRVGTDENGLAYRGDSCLIAPDPRGTLGILTNEVASLTLTVRRQPLDDLRRKLPFLTDRD